MSPSNKLLYRQLSLCITALQATLASGKAHTPCSAVPWCRRCLKQNLSLRREQGLACGLGHARSLTPHCGVIQDPRAALLPRPTM